MPDRSEDSTPQKEPSQTPIFDALPLKRRRFVTAYVEEPNAAAAARSAGHRAATPHVASATGSRLLASDGIRAAVSEVAAAALAESGTSAAEALAALAHIMVRPADLGAGPAVSAASAVLRVALPEQGAPTSQHLHLNLEPEKMRAVAQRLAAELGAPGPSPPPDAN